MFNDTKGEIWVKYLLPITSLTFEGIALSEYGEWSFIMFNSKLLDDDLSILTELMVDIEKSLILIISLYAHCTAEKHFKSPNN